MLAWQAGKISNFDYLMFLNNMVCLLRTSAPHGASCLFTSGRFRGATVYLTPILLPLLPPPHRVRCCCCYCATSVPQADRSFNDLAQYVYEGCTMMLLPSC